MHLKRLMLPCIAGVISLSLGSPVQAVIYGEDDRLEVFEVKKSYKDYSRSIAVIAPAANLVRSGENYSWNLGKIPRLSAKQIDGRKISEEERFSDQPLCGVGTAFLIAPDIIVTAGHCVMNEGGEITVRDMAIVFDYAINPKTQRVDKAVSKDNVYFCKRAITIKYDKNTGQDFAIIRLDRAVTGRPPLKVRQEGKIEDASRLILIGHPHGLPSKIAINARVRNNGPEEYFLTDLDAFPGNSGSPVLDAKTGVVEGILVRGPAKEWTVEPISDRLEISRFEVKDARSRGTHVQRINAIPEISDGLAAAMGLFDLIRQRKTKEVIARLKRGVDPDIRNDKGHSLLFYAMAFSDLEVAKVLIDLEVPVFTRDHNNWTCLHVAARNNNLEGVQLLIENDHPINVVTPHGQTPLYLAQDKKNAEVAAYLISAGADEELKPTDEYLLFRSFSKDTPKAVLTRKLFEAVASEGDWALPVSWLLSFGADANARDEKKRTPLCLAVSGTFKPKVMALLLSQVSIDAECYGYTGESPLHRAVVSWPDKDKNVAFLLEHGAKVNVTSRDGQTPLHIAAHSNSREVILLLLKSGAAIHALAGVNFKFDKNVMRAAPSNERWTPLHYAAAHGTADIAQLLVEKGANIHSVDFTGATPLHVVASYSSLFAPREEPKHVELVKFFLGKGASKRTKNRKGKTPYDLARTANIRRLLK